MVELVAAVCPKCGSKLEFPGDLKIAHCIYCGAKVIIEESKPDVHYHGIGTVENYVELGRTMYRRGHSEKAIEYYDKALEINAKSIEAWYGKGLIEERRGDDTDALFCYNKVLEINPEHERTKKRIEAMHKAMHREELNFAEERYRDGLEAEKKGHYGAALGYYTRVLGAFKIHPVDKNARKRMEVMHENVRKRIEAMYRDTLNEAENKLKKLISELKRLKQGRKVFWLGSSFVILILIFLALSGGIGMGLVCTAICILPILGLLVVFAAKWAGRYGGRHMEGIILSVAIRSKQAEISKQREIIDDLKRHPPDKENLKSFIDYFDNYLRPL